MKLGFWERGPWPCLITHFVRLAQVHEEFKQNIENISVEMLLRKFAESKGTGQEKPGESGHLWGLGCGAVGKEQDSRGKRMNLSGLRFPHQKNGLMTNLTQQPTEEEDLLTDLMCKSLTTGYQRGLECRAQPFTFFPEGPREPLRVAEQKTNLKMSRYRVEEELRAEVLGSHLGLCLFFVAHCVTLDVCLAFSESQFPHL